MGSPTTTRAGSPVIVGNKIGDYLFGAYEGLDGVWYAARWGMDGKYHTEVGVETALDLAQVPLEV